MRSRCTSERGTGALEVMVAVAIFAIVISISFQMAGTSLEVSGRSIRQGTATDNAQVAISEVEQLLRGAIAPAALTQAGAADNCAAVMGATDTAAFSAASTTSATFCSMSTGGSSANLYELSFGGSNCATTGHCVLSVADQSESTSAIAQSVETLCRACETGSASGSPPFIFSTFTSGAAPSALNSSTTPAVPAAQLGAIQEATIAITVVSAPGSAPGASDNLGTNLVDAVVLPNAFGEVS